MQVSETQIDEVTRQFHVAVPAAEIDEKVEARLSELAHTVRLPGFRPGKVPVALLRRRYGDSVKTEVIEQAINETSQSVISERGIRAALPPRVEVAAMPGPGDLEYTMAVELLPEITPPDYAQITLERLIPETDEADLEQRLQRFAEALGEETPVAEDRVVAAGDIVVIDVLSPEDRYPFETDDGRGARVPTEGEGMFARIGEQLVGLAKGARATVRATLPDDARADLASTERVYEVEIRELRQRTPAAIDDALAQRGGWEDLEDLKNWLRRSYEGDLKSIARLRLKRALLDRLAELYGFAVPKTLLQREYEQLVRQLASGEGGAEAAEPAEHVHTEACEHDHDHDHGHAHPHGETHDHDAGEASDAATAVDAALTEERRQELHALAERRVRLGLLLAEIGRANNLQVTQEELGKAMIAQARRFPGQEQQVIGFLRNNPEAREALAAPILEEKVVDFILEMAKVSERSVPAAELLREVETTTT